MTAYVGIKSKKYGNDINSDCGLYSPIHYFYDELPKELVELDGHYLGDGRSGSDHNIWKNEYHNTVKKLLELVKGKIIDTSWNTIIEHNMDFGEDFGKYIIISYGRD